MRRTVIIQCLLSLALRFIHVSSLTGVRTGGSSLYLGRSAHVAGRAHSHSHYCRLGSTPTGRGRIELQCGTTGNADMTAPTSPSTLSQLWLPMQPAIRAANRLVCRVWESLKESGTIFTRCALKLTAAALLMLSMVLSSPSTSRAARSDAKHAIISQQQSVKQKSQSKVDDNKKIQSKVDDNKKTQSKVGDNKKTQSKVGDNKKIQSKVDDNKKFQSKVGDNKKIQSKVDDNK